MIAKEVLTQYAHVYRNLLSTILKKDVGIDMRVFPWKSGAIFIVKIGFDIKNTEDIRTEAESIEEAKKRAHLENVDLHQIAEGDSFYLFNKNKIALIKPESSGWEESDAIKDIDKLNSIISSN